MILVQMGRDHDLKPVAPHLLCQLHADLMGDVWRDLSDFEALVSVPSDIIIVLPVLLLGQNHLLQSYFPPAVDGIHILFGSLIRTADIFEDIEKIFRPFRHGFLRILHIVYEV